MWDVITDDKLVHSLRDGYPRALDSLEATLEPAASDRRFGWVLRCPSDTPLADETEDQIVELSLEHLRGAHPDMADTYEREDVLFMARRFVPT